jgi:hypothetical protein
MKRLYIIILAAALVLGLAVPTALAALTDNQKSELEALYAEQHQLRLRILEKQVEFGLVTPEDADQIRGRMEDRWARRQQKMAEGDFAFGFGKNAEEFRSRLEERREQRRQKMAEDGCNLGSGQGS